ncbi:MAG: hypothetical protein MUF34_18765 [Polyangiaceae bacterium]|nr:hypothetical protein [Polyangiaceae bacterium]
MRAYPAALRALAVFLQVLAALNVAYIGENVILDLLEGTRRAPALLVAQALAAFSGGPWALTALLRRLRRAKVELGATHLTLTLRGTQVEIPLASIKALRPFALPLPGAGLALELASGRRFRQRLLLDAPGALLAALAERLPAARGALGRPPVAFADAQHERSRQPWYFWALKWGVYPLVLTVIVFRLNQFIMYGGPLGQYQMYGLGPYLKSFLNYWASTAGGLALYAAIVRALAEPLAFALTWLLPARARLFRGGAEIVCQGAYFVLVPAFVALRFLL